MIFPFRNIARFYHPQRLPLCLFLPLGGVGRGRFLPGNDSSEELKLRS